MKVPLTDTDDAAAAETSNDEHPEAAAVDIVDHNKPDDDPLFVQSDAERIADLYDTIVKMINEQWTRAGKSYWKKWHLS